MGDNSFRKMKITEYLDKYNINWFPIILTFKPTGKIVNGVEKIDKVLEKVPHLLYNHCRPKYTELKDINLCNQRQRITNIDFNAIWIDTNKVFQIDTDRPLDDNEDYKLMMDGMPHYKSITKPYGLHGFIRVDKLEEKNPFRKGKYSFKCMEGRTPINKEDDVELLCGQGAYAMKNAMVYWKKKEEPPVQTQEFFDIYVHNLYDKPYDKPISNDIPKKSKNCQKFWDYCELLTNETISKYNNYWALICCHKNLCGSDDYDKLDNFLEDFDGYDYRNNRTHYLGLYKEEGYGWKKFFEMIDEDVGDDKIRLAYKKNLDDKYNDFINVKRLDDDAYVAERFHQLYKDDFLIKDEDLYYYKKPIWIKDTKDKAYLNKFLHDNFYKKIIKCLNATYKKELVGIDTDGLEAFEDKWREIKKNAFVFKKGSYRRNLIYDIGNTFIVKQSDDIEFENKPDLFVFDDKVWDLRKQEFVEPNPNDYLLYSSGYKFLEDEQLEDKMKLLEKIFEMILPKKEIRDYTLQVLATGLTGHRVDAFHIWNGGGRNGKGVMMKLTLAVCGDYGLKADATVITEKNTDSAKPNPSRAALDNKRFVNVVEPDENIPFNCGTIKELTGEETIQGRFLHSNQNTIHLKETLCCECNAKPKMKEQTNSMLQRIRDVFFPSTFTDFDEDLDDEALIFKKNREYDTQPWRDEMKMAMFMLLQPYLQNYYNKNRNLDPPQEIKERNLQYLANSNDFYTWFKSQEDIDDGDEHNFRYEKVEEKTLDEGREYLSLTDVYNDYKLSPYFNTLTAKEKRKHNKKFIINEIALNPILKKYYKNEYQIGKNDNGTPIKKKCVLRCYRRIDLGYKIDNNDDM